MHEVCTLLMMELRSFFGVNRFFHTKDAKEKRRFRMLAIAWFFIIIIGLVYDAGLAWLLCYFGLGASVPGLLTMLSSAIILFFGIFKSGHRIFGSKGYDLLVSLPVHPRSIVISRFLSLYFAELMLSAGVFLPATVVYGLYAAPAPLFYGFTFLIMLIVPAIPLILSTVIGTAIAATTARIKRKSLTQTALMILFTIAMLLISFNSGKIAESIDDEQLMGLASAVEGIAAAYPPALWVNQALADLQLLPLLLFSAVSAAVLALGIWASCRAFPRIMRRMSATVASHHYKLGLLGQRGLLRALYQREAKRYFASPIYVTNTIIGPAMAVILSVALCVSDWKSIADVLPIDVTNLVPVLLSAVLCMMPCAATSISMEGKQIWIVKSLPIPEKTWLDSKLLLNLSLLAPFYIACVIILAIGLQASFVAILWLLLLPACIMIFSVVLALAANLRFHSFTWEKEEIVVKQSLPAALGGFAPFLLCILLAVALALTPALYINLVKGGICLVLLALAFLLYRKNCRTKLTQL